MAGFEYKLTAPPISMVAESTSVGAYEAKTHLPRLLDEVAAGRTVVITRHGRPAARLVPVDPRPDPRKVIAALREFRADNLLGDHDLSTLVAEGRR